MHIGKAAEYAEVGIVELGCLPGGWYHRLESSHIWHSTTVD
jgi:hypothetical protein